MRREFIANAAHELRTPLTNLKGYLEALRDGVIPADRATFESLLEEAERLVRLSRSLDTLAGGRRGRRPTAAVELDLAATIRAAVDLARPSLARGGPRARSRPARADSPPAADPDQLAQVARQPPPERGPLHAARRPRLGPRRATPATTCSCRSSNTGDGIPAEDLPHVFERFYRVEKSRDRARGGAGIGLAIVRQLVEAAGGAVGVESRDGPHALLVQRSRRVAPVSRPPRRRRP